jgi:RNA polymerase sigma factor (sigma-70 family)
MHLEFTTQAALTAPRALSAEALAVRQTRGCGGQFPPTPKDLLSRAQRSDPEATSALLRTYWDAIHSFLRSQGARQEEAPDLTQATALGAWRRLAQFCPQKSGSFRAWLRTIAKNRLLNLRREQARRAKLESTPIQVELERQLVASQAPCSEQLLRRERALLITDCVWRRVAEQYRAAGRQALFDYLYKSMQTGITHGDQEFARALGNSDGYAAKCRNDLVYTDYPKALRAEYRERFVLKSQGRTPAPTFKEWTRALLDDLA